MSWRESARGGLKNARQFAGRLIREYDNLKGTFCQGAKRDFRNIPAQKPKFPFWNATHSTQLHVISLAPQSNFCDL
jgi:hypothetical protein